jgi:hypothetical protein
MEKKVLNLVFEIRQHEDRTANSFLAFCQPLRGVDITKLSKEFNKQSAQITWKMPENQLFGTTICL